MIRPYDPMTVTLFCPTHLEPLKRGHPDYKGYLICQAGNGECDYMQPEKVKE